MTGSSQHAEFVELARNLGAGADLVIRGGPGVGGAAIHLSATIGSKGALMGARFRISLTRVIAPYVILFRHERGMDRAGKGLGINREVQTGDPTFDDAVYIETDGRDEDVVRLLSEARVRDPIREIVTERVESLTMGGNSVIDDGAPAASSLRLSIDTKAFADVAALKRALGAMVRLAQEMERSPHASPYRGGESPAEVAPAARPRWVRGVVLSAACVAVNLAGWYGLGFGTTPPTFGWAAYGKGALGGAATWVLLVALSGALLRGRSTSFRYVIAFALFALPTILMGGRLAERINADAGAPSHTEPGVAVLRARSKGGPAYEVTRTSTKESVYVGDPHRDAVPFSYTPLAIELTLGEGTLGSPYVRQVRPAAR